MVACFVAAWRIMGNVTAPNAPDKVAPRHAAILVTRPAEKMTDEQRHLLTRIVIIRLGNSPSPNLPTDSSDESILYKL